MPEGDPNKLFFNIYADGTKSNTVGFVVTKQVEGVNIKDILYGSINSIVNGDKTVDQWRTDLIEAVKKFN